MNNTILINGKEYPYVIIHKNIKHIYFRVKSDLVLYITCPKHVNKSNLNSLIEKEYSSIVKLYNNMIDKTTINNDITYLGQILKLKEYDGKPYISYDYIYAKDEITAKNYINTLAYEVFSSRLKQIINNFDNLPNFKLKVRKMVSKWGVCNKNSMSITLNLDLIKKDIHLIDYVIIHELCHFKYMNHSKYFWNEVSKHYPYYKKARKELNCQ